MKRAYVFILGDRAGLVLAITIGKAKEACCQGRVPGCSGTLRLDHPQGYCLPPTAACTAAELPGRYCQQPCLWGHRDLTGHCMWGISCWAAEECIHFVLTLTKSSDKDCTFLSPSPDSHWPSVGSWMVRSNVSMHLLMSAITWILVLSRLDCQYQWETVSLEIGSLNRHPLGHWGHALEREVRCGTLVLPLLLCLVACNEAEFAPPALLTHHKLRAQSQLDHGLKPPRPGAEWTFLFMD